MRTNHFRVMTILILILLILTALLIAAANPGTADAAEGCPPPEGLRPALYMPIVGQNHIDGMIDCIKHPYKCLGR